VVLVAERDATLPTRERERYRERERDARRFVISFPTIPATIARRHRMTLQVITLPVNNILHYIASRCVALHYIALRCIHSIPFRSIPYHSIILHNIPFH
jgi:hypothetical protein